MGFEVQVAALVDAFFVILLEVLREQFSAFFALVDVIQALGN